MKVEETDAESPLLISVSEGVATLTLHRPKKRNALDRDLVQKLGQALHLYGSEEAVRVILLRGAGGAFCAGADLASIERPRPEELSERIDEFHQLILGIVGTDKPVIALIDGAAVGFGADLALACDMRLFSDAGYIEEAFVKIGLMPDGGGTHFIRRFAGARAFELLALGTRLSASDCKDLGIANEIVTRASLDRAGLDLAQRLSVGAPLALAKIKRALRLGEEAELIAALAREKDGQSTLIQSEDYQTGLLAFRNKQTPKFRGR